ncbi:MAG: right-handed parallel beta-helix repeat-containing protein, partial [Calditrichales bacterium]|nr:right-handed parallel beta-helix repeat-containing protein [Calditrichales bacterium]
MKTRLKYLLSILVSALFFNVALFASDSFNFPGSSQIEIFDFKAEDGLQYAKISLEGFFNGGQPGEPELPVEYVNLIIPSDQTAVNIRVISSTEKEYILEKLLFPAQHDRPTTDREINIPFSVPKSEIYQSADPYPDNIVNIIKHNWFDGDKHIVTLAISPVCYFPKENKIILHTDIQYEIEYSSGAKGALHVENRSAKQSVFYNELLKNVVSNPDDIPVTSASNSLFKMSSGQVPFYEYVVITPNDFTNSFNRLLDWKKRKGLDAGIVTVEEILNNYTTDHISGITDDAGAIRQYLYDAYTGGGTVFVLMGGDYNFVPIRYGCGSNNTWDYHYSGGTIYDGYKIPADLYFCDFNGDWDVDGDVYTGEESDDNPDYGPEIFVGRLICSSTDDILNWTEKVILYEQNPGKRDVTYLTNSFMIASDQLISQPDYVKTHFPSSFTHEVWKELPSGGAPNPTFPFGHEVVTEMNTTRYAIWSWFAHGSPISTVCKAHLYNKDIPTKSYLRAWDNLDIAPGANEPGNGMDNLDNTSHPTLVYSIACENMPFDDFETNLGQRNLAEAFTSMFSGGGPAFLGNTRFGWVDYSYRLYQKFADLLTTGGASLHLGVSEAVSRQNNTSKKHYLSYSHNLVGCPETKMWVQAPSSFTSVSVTDGGSYLTVDAGLSDCDISVCSIDNGQSYHLVASGVSSYTFTTSIRPLYVTISREHYLPFIGITGGSISSDITLYGKLEIIDDINITNDKTLTIDQTSSILLASDVSITVDAGSKIVAIGTEDNPISFRRSGSSAWDRIQLNGGNNEFEWCVFDGGSYNVDVRSSNNSFSNCTSMNANRGIYFYNGATGTVSNSKISNNNYGVYLYKSKPTIQDCEINDCTTAGIYLSDNNSISGDADIINNSIHDHDNYGIFCYKSSPEIRENTIETNYKGVYCTNSSSPIFGAYHVSGNNIINDCYIGLIANYSSDPALYLPYPGMGGWNQIINASSFIHAYNYSNVYAEYTWWGSSPPDHNKFSAYYYSSIDYTPWLTSNPSDPPPPESSPPNSVLSSSDYNSGYDENWPLKRKIDYAKSLIYLDNPGESKKICGDIIDLYPDSSLSFLALNVYWAADRYQSDKEKTGQKDFQNLLINLSAKKYKCELYGYSELLLADFEGDKGLSRIDKVYNEYKDSFLPEAALYQKFLYYLDGKDDLSSALIVNEQLNEEYPKSLFTEWSNEHLSDESSSNEKLSKADISLKENGLPIEYNLFLNFPNPFNPSTRVKYALPKSSNIQIAVYNSIGQKIKSFKQNQQPCGVHFIRWDGKNDAGLNVPSGL